MESIGDIDEFFSPGRYSPRSEDDEYYTADEASPPPSGTFMSHYQNDPLTSLPLEIVLQIVDMGLCARDVYNLRFVSRACYQLFTSPLVCGFIVGKFFTRSPEMDVKSEHKHRLEDVSAVIDPEIQGKADAQQGDLFRNCVRRAIGYKAGVSTECSVLGTITHESTSLDELAFDANVEEGVIAYQIDKRTIAIRDILDDKSEVVIDLAATVGECMVHSGRGQFSGFPNYTLSINRGRLVISGAPHSHLQIDEEVFSILEDMNIPTDSHPIPLVSEIGTIYAVFSTEKHDRGKLLHKWVESGHPLNKSRAHNEYYFLNDYNIHVQELRGYIYPTAGREGHRFHIDKKNLYPPAAFTFAADTRGLVFYVGCWCRERENQAKTFLEVYNLPCKDQSTGVWAAPQLIKRVGLRSQSVPQSLRFGLPREHWSFELSPGRRVDKFTRQTRRGSPGYEWKDGEDYVRITIKGNFCVPQTHGESSADEMAMTNVMFWDITARPSPLEPAPITEFLGGRTWKLDNSEWPDPSNPYADANGKMDYEEAYPTPTYFTSSSSEHWSEVLNNLPDIPSDLDIDTLNPEDLAVYPLRNWMWQKPAVDGSGGSNNISQIEGDKDLRRVLILFGHKNIEYSNYTSVELPRPDSEVPGLLKSQSCSWGDYPAPGEDDKTFVPAGFRLVPRWRIVLRPQNPYISSSNVPFPPSSSMKPSRRTKPTVKLDSPPVDFQKMITSYKTRKRRGVVITDPSNLEAALRHKLEDQKWDKDVDDGEEWGCFHETMVFDWKFKQWWLAFRYSKLHGKVGTRIIAMKF